MTFKGYIATVTEYEAGWGSRPDGYLICKDKAKGQAFATKERGKVWRSDRDFCEASDFKLCILTDAGVTSIQETEEEVRWVSKSCLERLVEEHD